MFTCSAEVLLFINEIIRNLQTEIDVDLINVLSTICAPQRGSQSTPENYRASGPVSPPSSPTTSSAPPRSAHHLFAALPLQHAGDAQIFVDQRPVNAHRHEFIFCALRCRCAQQARIPRQRRYDLAAVHKRDDELRRGKLYRARLQVADIKLDAVIALPENYQ